METDIELAAVPSDRRNQMGKLILDYNSTDTPKRQDFGRKTFSSYALFVLSLPVWILLVFVGGGVCGPLLLSDAPALVRGFVIFSLLIGDLAIYGFGFKLASSAASQSDSRTTSIFASIACLIHGGMLTLIAYAMISYLAGK